MKKLFQMVQYNKNWCYLKKIIATLQNQILQLLLRKLLYTTERPFCRPTRPHSSPLMGILVKIGVRAFIDASTNPIGGRGLVFSGGELFIFYME